MTEIEHMKVGEDELWEEWARWGKLMAKPICAGCEWGTEDGWQHIPVCPLNTRTMKEIVAGVEETIAAVKTGPLDNDIVRVKPELERKREWEHGREGAGKDCGRQKVYTAPEKIPDTCRRPHCDNTEWFSKGVVVRNKATKEILDREG